MSAAEEAGKDARNGGCSPDGNPYDFESEHTEWEAWRRGWMEADEAKFAAWSKVHIESNK